MASVNDKLERIRKPRVHIKYDVEMEGSEVEKELPFTIGVIGDFAGNHPGHETKPLKQRKFVNIDRDNLNDVIQNIKPGITMRVPNKLSDEDSELAISLQFKSMHDFEPANVIAQIPALKKLKSMRDRLRDLLSKTDRSDELENLLEAILKDPNKLSQLATELKIKPEEESHD